VCVCVRKREKEAGSCSAAGLLPMLRMFAPCSADMFTSRMIGTHRNWDLLTSVTRQVFLITQASYALITGVKDNGSKSSAFTPRSRICITVLLFSKLSSCLDA
jgi:hypothetical protein